MKIGIITYFNVCNFGANLQALSTFEYFKKCGHDPIMISWFPLQLEQQYINSTSLEQFEIHNMFCKQHFKMTERCLTEEDVAYVIDKYCIEAVVIGSDAVVQYIPKRSRIIFPCRKIYVKIKPAEDRNCPNPFWGSFHKLLKRPIPMAMMSVSCQNSPYKSLSREEKDMLTDHLLRFSYISTRDDWTKKQLTFASRNMISPLITPDPVFAFNFNVNKIPVKEEILKRYKLPEKYVLISFHNSKTVTQKWLKELQDKLMNNNIKCVAFPFPQGIEFNHPFEKEIALPLNPIDWYALIKYSTAYIGHNMHPIIVCLSNAVPCFSFDNYGKSILKYFVNQKSSKIYHIMKHFNLLKNRANSAGKFIENPSVDKVLNQIETYDTITVKEMSQKFLNQYLSMMNDIMNIFEQK